MEIIKDLRPCNKKYKFIHTNCCEFIANGDEFTWTCGRYNETVAKVVCPQCGKQFYDDPEEISPETLSFDDWPKVTNCPRNCKKCQAKCLYRKEQYTSED
jgi:hypothetical protein